MFRPMMEGKESQEEEKLRIENGKIGTRKTRGWRREFLVLRGGFRARVENPVHCVWLLVSSSLIRKRMKPHPPTTPREFSIHFTSMYIKHKNLLPQSFYDINHTILKSKFTSKIYFFSVFSVCKKILLPNIFL